MEIRGDDSVVVTQINGGDSFTLDGTVDKENKTFTVQMDGGQPDDVDDSAHLLVDEDAADPYDGTFGYSIENDTLTLTEREYGEQIVFERE